MHASTLLPTILLLTLSPLTFAKPLPPQNTDGPHRRGSPIDAPAPQFTQPHAKELSDFAATLNDIAARIAIPPPDVLGSTEHQPSSSDDDYTTNAGPLDLGVGNLDGIEGLNGASLLPDNTFAPRDPSPSTKQNDNGNQQTDPPRVKARHDDHDDGGEIDGVVEDNTFVPREPSPTDMQTGNRQTDVPHSRLLAALKARHGEREGHSVAAPLEDASEESDDEGDDESEGYDDDDEEEAVDPFTELSGEFGGDDAPTYAAPNKRQSGHEGHSHGGGAAAAGTNPLDTTAGLAGLGFPSTGGQGGETNPIDIASLGSGIGSGGQKKRTAQDLSSLTSGLGQLGSGASGLTDGLSSGLGNAGGLPGADGLEGLGKVAPGLGGGAAGRRKRRGVGWAA